MKRLALLYVALMTGTVALAQQSPEWRPSLAEDNKAATWEETSSFLTSVLNNRQPGIFRLNELVGPGSFTTEFGIEIRPKTDGYWVVTLAGTNEGQLGCVEGVYRRNVSYVDSFEEL